MKKSLTAFAALMVLLTLPVFADSGDSAEIQVDIEVQQFAELTFADAALAMDVDGRSRAQAHTKVTILANFDHTVEITAPTDPKWQMAEGTDDFVMPFLVNGAGENGDLTMAYSAQVHKGYPQFSNRVATVGGRVDENAVITFDGHTPGEESVYTLYLSALMDETYGGDGRYSDSDTLAIADEYEGELTFSVVAQ